MVNLFTSLNKADDGAIAMQIALLKSVTFANITKPYVQKMGRGVVKASKWIAGKLFDKQINIDEPKVTEINELIAENYDKLQGTSRAELDELLREELKKRTGKAFGAKKKYAEKLSFDEELSAAIIDEAAKHFDNIGVNLTLAQKADAIAGEFHNRMRDKVNEELKKQNAEQAADMERKLEEDIKKLTPKERLEMQKVLRVNELTGKTVRGTLLKAGLPALALGTTSGLGVFVATTTIMHAIFTTVLGITLPFAAYTGAMSFLGVLTGPIGWVLVGGVAAYNIVSGNNKIDREMLSQCIYLAFVLNGKPFAPLESELAEWEANEKVNQNTDINMRNRMDSLYNDSPSMVSEEELKRQIAELRREMEEQNERNRKIIEAEFLEKKKKIEQNAAIKEEELAKLIRERDEIIERKEIESDRKLFELQAEYEKTIRAQNKAIAAMRKEQDAIISQLEKNKSNKPLRNAEIRKKLHTAINSARYEIDIMSPWMNRHVVNDTLINELKAAVNRGVIIKIRYGIGDNSSGSYGDSRAQTTERTAEMLREKFAPNTLKLKRGNEHSKLFICDDEFYVITSFNPLSFDGDYSQKGQRGEMGELSVNKENLQEYRSIYFSF